MGDLLAVTLRCSWYWGAGYLAGAQRADQAEGVDGLMKFAQGIAVPCLLFRAIADLDLTTHLDPRLLASFYGGAFKRLCGGAVGGRFLLGRPWGTRCTIGFVGLFSNSLMLGLPITERAFGPDALAANYAIIAFHAPLCYILGITARELARAGGQNLARLPH